MTINLLNRWAKEFHAKSSDLNLKQYDGINRPSIEFIVAELKFFFGESYFSIPKNKFLRGGVIYWHENYIFQVLLQTDIHSYFYLLDLACLINYAAAKMDKKIIAKLKSLIKEPSRLRDYFFEIFVYRMLAGNGYPTQAKPLINDKEVEGYFFIGTKYWVVFECKKLYSTETRRIKHLTTISKTFFNQWLKYRPDIHGFIIAPNQDDDSISEEKQLLEKALSTCFKNFNLDKPFYLHNKNGDCILQIEKRNIGIYEHQQNLLPKPHWHFLPIPPPIVQKNEQYYRMKTGINLKISHSALIGKLNKEIKNKRRQLEQYPNSLRLFFFENEIAFFSDIPLLSEPHYDENSIMEYLEKKESNDIICIIDKKFVKNPKLSLRVFCRNHLKEVKDLIEKLDPCFLSY